MFTKQRLNVALSRAKNKLIIIGDSLELCKYEETLKIYNYIVNNKF